MSDTTIHNRPGASIVRAFRRINAAAEVIAAARAYVLAYRARCQREIAEARHLGYVGVAVVDPSVEYTRLDAAITAYDLTETT